MAEKKTVPMAVHVLLDCSGSMQSNQMLAIKAANEFIRGLATSIMPSTVTMSKFNSGCVTMIDSVPVYDLPELDTGTYTIAGGTNVWRAVLHAIKHLDETAADTKIVIVFTDGTSDPVESARAIASVAERKAEGWLFLFVGMVADTGDMRVAMRYLKEEAHQMGVLPEHLAIIKPHTLEETMAKAAMACLEFKGTGQTKM